MGRELPTAHPAEIDAGDVASALRVLESRLSEADTEIDRLRAELARYRPIKPESG